MTLNLAQLESVLQAQVDALTAGTDKKTLLLLTKALEAGIGHVSLWKMAEAAAIQLVGIDGAGTTNVGLVNSAGVDQVAAVNAAGVAQVAAVNALAVAKLAELNATTALQKTGGTMTGPLIGDVGVIADTSTITLDFGVKQNFEIATSGARTMANPLNASTKGLEGTIEITGSPTFSWGDKWRFSNNVLPSFTGRSILSYRVKAGGVVDALVIPNFG